MIWYANRGNWASRKLAWRLGFSFDGTLRSWLPQRGELLDGWVGILLRDDPRGRHDLAGVPGRGGRRPAAAALSPTPTSPASWRAAATPDPVLAGVHAARPGRGRGQAYLETRPGAPRDQPPITGPSATRDDDRPLGVVGLYRMPDVEPEVGYWAHPEARGRGLTTTGRGPGRSGTPSRPLGLERLAAYASAPHAASRRVLEANGMRPDRDPAGGRAHRAGEVVDLAGYDLLATDVRT